MLCGALASFYWNVLLRQKQTSFYSKSIIYATKKLKKAKDWEMWNYDFVGERSLDEQHWN